jgi:uncharacterized protein (DUF2249 family)
MISRPFTGSLDRAAAGEIDQAPLRQHHAGGRRSLAEEHAILVHEVRLRHRAVLGGLDDARWPDRELAALVAYLRYEVLDQAVTEERLLFPLTRERGTGSQVHGLAVDHVRIRDVTDQLAGLVATDGPPREATTLVDLLDGLEELLETHMWTEQWVLSPATGVESVRRPFRCHLWFPITEGPDIDLDRLPAEVAHAAALERLSRLRPGESVTIRCSTDLQSLWRALSRGQPEEFAWACLDEGPANWRAEIMRRSPE